MSAAKRFKQTPTRFNCIGDIFVSLTDLIQPPERITVSEAAEKYRYVNQPGAYVGPWLNETAPYMVKPMNTFASSSKRGLIFAGPAQSAKTDSLIINAVVYAVKVDPLDMMIVSPTMSESRDFSIRRIDRLNMHSKAVGEKLLTGADNDNTFDKTYDNGMLLTLTWPTVSTLAGKPIARVVLTDRDRMDDDIGGDGEPFDLAMKRTTTFGSYAMTVAESSPSRPVEDLKWVPKTLHEAPPCGGIMSLYNRGDRQRWYWPCLQCWQYFEGNFEMLEYDNWPGASNLDRAKTARLVCPHCSTKIHPNDRSEMQMWGQWVADGQAIDSSGRLFGNPPNTLISSFWLNGVAAAFTNWRSLVNMYLDAMDVYERTGSEEALKKFYNNDLGEPYYSKSLQEVRLPEALQASAEHLRERFVPAGVRFLVATIDIQVNMFKVQVFGILPGNRFDMVTIDRFEVRNSQRLDEDGNAYWIKPHAYLEDWEELIPQVIDREYPLDDDSGRVMRIARVGCDSNGKKGATAMAYNFYRKLVGLNKHRRFSLLRGDGTPNIPRARIAYPDSNRKDNKSGARGDVPVVIFNSNLLKDDLNGRLDCMVPGAGMYRTPDWLSFNFYEELCAEIRDPKKGWINVSSQRNESWDLSYYCIGLCISELMRVESIDWAKPPKWAADWDENALVYKPANDSTFAQDSAVEYDFSNFGKAIA